MTVIDELVTILGLNISPSAKANAEGFGKILFGIKGKAAIAAAALAGIGYKAYDLVRDMNEVTTEMEKFSRVTGISVEQVQAWDHVARSSGASINSVRGDLKSLTEQLNHMKPGQFNEGIFRLIGPGIKTAEEAIIRLSAKMQGMSKQQQLQAAGMVGLSEDTLLMMQRGPEFIKEMFADASQMPTIISDREANNAMRFTIELAKLKDVFSKFLQQVSSVAGPVLKEMNKELFNWLKNNKEWIKLKLEQVINGVFLGFKKVKEIFFAVVDAVKKMVPNFGNLVEKLDLTKFWATLVISALVTMAGAFIALAWPVLKVWAIITALVLVIEDLWTYFQGGDSATGAFIDSITSAEGTLAKKVPSLVKLTRTLYEAFNELGGKKLAREFWDTLVYDLKWVLAAFGELSNGVIRFAEAMASLASGGGLKGFMAALSDGNKGRLFADFQSLSDEYAPNPQTPVSDGSEFQPGYGPQIPAGIQAAAKPTTGLVGGSRDKQAELVALATASGNRGDTNNTVNITQNITGTSDPRATGNFAVDRLRGLLTTTPGLNGIHAAANQ
jgi:hypothetical protein